MKRLIDLSEREILALAIFSEEEDSKIYRGFAEGLREQYPASAMVFDEMADEEVRHLAWHRCPVVGTAVNFQIPTTPAPRAR
jgi:rubrerythrin